VQSSRADAVQQLRATAQNPQSITLEWKPPRTPGVFRYKVIHSSACLFVLSIEYLLKKQVTDVHAAELKVAIVQKVK